MAKIESISFLGGIFSSFQQHLNLDKLLPLLNFRFFPSWVDLWPTLTHYQADSFTKPVLISGLIDFQPKGNWKPYKEVCSLNPEDHSESFEPATSHF